VEHLSSEALEAFVMDAASPDAEAVRRHVAQCPWCAGRLEREARLEELLHAAGEAGGGVESAAGRPVARLRWSAPLQAAAVLLVVAAALWIRDTQRPASPPLPASRLEQASVPETTATARSHGAPGWDVESPRDYARWASPRVPCLDPGTTRRPEPAFRM
jgi:hypothetical protein